MRVVKRGRSHETVEFTVGRQLVTVDEARPAKGQHKKPCSDCPWARAALSGWTGALSPEEWLKAAHGDGIIECHTLIGAQCAGAAIYRKNVAKTPRDPNALRLSSDTKRVFSTPAEFTAHHAVPPRRRLELLVGAYQQQEKAMSEKRTCFIIPFQFAQGDLVFHLFEISS